MEVKEKATRLPSLGVPVGVWIQHQTPSKKSKQRSPNMRTHNFAGAAKLYTHSKVGALPSGRNKHFKKAKPLGQWKLFFVGLFQREAELSRVEGASTAQTWATSLLVHACRTDTLQHFEGENLCFLGTRVEYIMLIPHPLKGNTTHMAGARNPQGHIGKPLELCQKGHPSYVCATRSRRLHSTALPLCCDG